MTARRMRILGVIRQYKSRVEIVTGPNCGAPAARNRGLEQASAPFVMFLDADDYMEPSSLDCWLRDAIEADLVLGPFARELNGVRSKGAAPARPLSVSSLLVDWAAGRFTPPCAALWRTAYVRSIGGWAEDLRRNQDGELVVRAILNGARVKTSSSGLGVYVQHDQAPRISRRKDRRSIESELLAFRKIASAAAKDDHDVSEIIGQFFYSIARSAYKEEFCDLGDAALRDARKLGFKRTLGHKKPHFDLSANGATRKDTTVSSVREEILSPPILAWRRARSANRGLTLALANECL